MIFKEYIGNFCKMYVFIFHCIDKIRTKILQKYRSAFTCQNPLYNIFIVEQAVKNMHYLFFKCELH